jgi:hypothetical protein
LHRASENIASQRGIERGTSCTAGEHSMQRAIRTAYWVAIRVLSLCCYSSPPSRDGGSWLNVIRLHVAYGWRSDRMHVAAWELRITPGSPLCRGLTRAIYILCIEHRRMLRLSGNLTRDLLHCRRTLYAKSHSNGILSCHSGSQLVLLRYNHDIINTTIYNILLLLINQIYILLLIFYR